MISVEKFMWATALDLSMGYYAMSLAMGSRQYCVIVLPWRMYEYTALPMGLSISSDIFQALMNSLFQDMAQLYVYVDNIIILGSSTFEEHLKAVAEAIDRLIGMGMQINPRKTAWVVEDVDYLCLTITREGIKPQEKKIKAILSIKSPQTQTEVRHFVGLVNFYKKFYEGRSKTIAPITALTEEGVKFEWTSERQEAFETMKAVMAQDTLVSLPSPGEEFTVHTDASNEQIGGCVSQFRKPLAFFSNEISDNRTRVTSNCGDTKIIPHYIIRTKNRCMDRS